jgi:hypothetical protein
MKIEALEKRRVEKGNTIKHSISASAALHCIVLHCTVPHRSSTAESEIQSPPKKIPFAAPDKTVFRFSRFLVDSLQLNSGTAMNREERKRDY